LLASSPAAEAVRTASAAGEEANKKE